MTRKNAIGAILAQVECIYWLRVKTLNECINEATKVRVSEDGVLKLYFDNADLMMGVILNGTVIGGEGEIGKARVVSIQEPNGNYLYEAMYNDHNKSCMIL